MDENVKHGTTTVGIIAKDGVVLVADKRATMGHLIAHKHVDKILPITDRIVMTTAGAVGDAQMLVKYLQAEMSLYETKRYKKPSVTVAANLLANILFGNRMNFRPFFVQLLLAGYDETGPHLFSLGADGSNLEDKYISTGSGSVMAYGVLEDKFKEGLSIPEAIKIGARAVKAAISRDVYTGNGVDVYTITKEGYKKLSKEEIDKILS